MPVPVSYTHLDVYKRQALDNLADQICETQSLDGLDYSEETQYTSQVILGAVERALEKAKFPSEE